MSLNKMQDGLTNTGIELTIAQSIVEELDDYVRREFVEKSGIAKLESVTNIGFGGLRDPRKSS